MGVRNIVTIDEDLCTGCGDCVPSCAEGAIEIVDGKAKLIAENLCDGLGACLGDCPEGALKVEQRDADAFDESAVEERLAGQEEKPASPKLPPNVHAIHAAPAAHPHAHAHGPGGGCPGSRAFQFSGEDASAEGTGGATGSVKSELRQWPVQLHLVSPTAPYFEKADLLLAADCVAFSVGDFHSEHLKGRALAIACPKLDEGREIYLQKLVTMIDEAKINSLNVMVMEVPCCAGLVQLAKEAAAKATRKVPVKQIVVGIKGGQILSEEWV